MNEPSRPPAPPKFERKTFDESERDRIRQALGRYKDEQGLPMIRFADKIAEANGRKQGMVSRRTLERFMSGKFRVDDDFVNYCDTFLQTQEPPPPLEVMGDAIVAFFDRVPQDAEPRQAHIDRLHAMFAPLYRCYLRGERTDPPHGKSVDDPNWPVPETDAFTPPHDIPYALIRLEPLFGTPYLKVGETVVNPSRDTYWSETQAAYPGFAALDVMKNFHGVLARCATAQLYVISVRKAAYGHPKFYILFDPEPRKATPESILLGSCVGVADNPIALSMAESFDVMLVPVAE